MMFSKTVKIALNVKCDIHNTTIYVRKFFRIEEADTIVYEFETSICAVDDGCSPDNYVFERVW